MNATHADRGTGGVVTTQLNSAPASGVGVDADGRLSLFTGDHLPAGPQGEQGQPGADGAKMETTSEAIQRANRKIEIPLSLS